ncbi:Pycsar system effector family protein [Pararcticibacter amylolyticus]|uniref:Phosphohydrolase n=1 Tax=Pararcticibacter amylolyticus TaxID=2173175 RepID=A0A2U2PLI0_9SPHI|nr:Pycsar system effector family protein [Pararcticibacter amylolyticus]PWG82029.1 phosphohydrolase [Pararcticibacter amylolyticus]
MSDYHELSRIIKDYVSSFYKEHHNPILTYHNEKHTEDVVAAAAEIADHYHLSEKDYFIVTAAAWFHDLGYYISMDNHEYAGANLVADFLRKHKVDEEINEAVQKCILSTRMPQNPANLNEMIVCDADLFHLGRDSFREKNRLMRKEFESISGVKISKSEWRESTIRLLKQHKYHTDYCRLLLGKGKEENLQELEKKQEEKARPQEPSAALIPLPAEEKSAESGKKNKDRPDRGIETMFRVSSSNHQRLSDMADNKSHILITVNSIILSAIISLLLRRLEDHIYLAGPTFILLTVSLLSIIYSILSTRPTIPDGIFTQKDIDEKSVNLLFFGNFYKMSLEDYSAGMWKTMEDKSFLYGSLIRDVYSQGIVLGKKYRLLRIAYNIFMYGLIISVLAFIIMSAIHGKD